MAIKRLRTGRLVRRNGHRAKALILAPEGLIHLLSTHSKKLYLQGSILFTEGEPASGIYLLSTGAAKISISDGRGKTLVLGTAGPGEILGLSAAVAGAFHEVTAETILPSQVVFIGREEFLRLLENQAEAAFWVVQVLSDDVAAAHRQLRRVW